MTLSSCCCNVWSSIVHNIYPAKSGKNSTIASELTERSLNYVAQFTPEARSKTNILNLGRLLKRYSMVKVICKPGGLTGKP